MLESLHYAMVGPEGVNEFQNLRKVLYIHSLSGKGGGKKEDPKSHIYLTFLFCKYKSEFSINQDRQASYRTETLQYMLFLFLEYR